MEGVTRSSTVAWITVPSIAPPAESTAPFDDGVLDELADAARGRGVDDAAERGLARRRVAGLQALGFRCERRDELVGDRLVDDDALGRHADLALVHERAESGRGDRRPDVRVVEHDQRRLAAEFQQRRPSGAGRRSRR